jgi:hypothetical protein
MEDGASMGSFVFSREACPARGAGSLVPICTQIGHAGDKITDNLGVRSVARIPSQISRKRDSGSNSLCGNVF